MSRSPKAPHSGGCEPGDPLNVDRVIIESNFSRPKDIDLFRDTPVRYLGYANEVGEAFRAFVHRNLVRGTYIAASCYVVADAAHKGHQGYNKFKDRPECRRLVTQEVVDTLIWQGLASVIIPGFTINRLCWLSTKVLSRFLAAGASKSISTAVGLSAIPFIVRPIDGGVDRLMNGSFRVWFNNEKLLEDQLRHTRQD